MKNKTWKIFNWILNVLLVVLIIVGIYLFAARIFGDSPTDFQLISWTAGLLIAGMVKMANLIYNLNREIGEFKVKSISSFKVVKSDIGLIKTNIQRIREDIKTDISKLIRKRKWHQ